MRARIRSLRQFIRPGRCAGFDVSGCGSVAASAAAWARVSSPAGLSILGQEPLEPSRDDELLDLTQRGAVVAEVEVLRELLGDRAAATDLIAVLDVVPGRSEQRAQIGGIEHGEVVVARVIQLLAQRVPVDAVMLREVAVLGDDDGAAQVRSDVVERNPLVAQLERVAARTCLLEALLHESGRARVTPA
jgi:hypothetical protein